MNKRKILIVDDESQHQIALMDILEMSGHRYELLSAFNGDEALRIAESESPDLIVTDWEMPGMSGLELTGKIRQHEALADIPVLMCTGVMTSSAHLKIALEAGANDYIRKPFDVVEVNARIHAMMAFRLQELEKIQLKKELWQAQFDRQQEALVVTKSALLYNNRNVDRIVSDLEEISQEVSDTCKAKIRALISNFKMSIQQTNWKEIELHFEKTHPAFLSQLIQDYPSLTANEVELCIFLKLNMSTKEIQAISYKSTDALKKARQRLKSKFALGREDSLYQFIQDF